MTTNDKNCRLRQRKHTGYEMVTSRKDYYFEDELSDIFTASHENSFTDADMYHNANYYSDEEIARNNARADQLMRRLRRFSVQHRTNEINWKNSNTRKYSIIYNYAIGKFTTRSTYSFRESNQVYFDSEQHAQQAINYFKNELLWYFTKYQDCL